MAMLPLTHDRSTARHLGRTAVEISTLGFYEVDGTTVSIHGPLYKALQRKVSIPPDAELPKNPNPTIFSQTTVQIRNVSSMDAAKELIAQGYHPMILNFANPITPGGGFLNGALAQEETLCRSSGLYATLLDDPMYAYHKGRFDSRMASDWAILSPNVPFFRTPMTARRRGTLGVQQLRFQRLDSMKSMAPRSVSMDRCTRLFNVKSASRRMPSCLRIQIQRYFRKPPFRSGTSLAWMPQRS